MKDDQSSLAGSSISHLAPLCLFINLIFLICFFTWFEPKPDLVGGFIDLTVGSLNRGLTGHTGSTAESGPTVLAQAFNVLRWVFVYGVGLAGIAVSVKAIARKFSPIHVVWIVCNAALLGWTLLMAITRLF